jgi:hypothetical protein
MSKFSNNFYCTWIQIKQQFLKLLEYIIQFLFIVTVDEIVYLGKYGVIWKRF